MNPLSAKLKVLVAIANFGTGNDRFLQRLLDEYRGMPYDIDLVVTSNLQKDLGDDVSVVVGLPTSNPHSLPFSHRQIFAARKNDYDLFIYSEDDTLITAGHIEQFLSATCALPESDIAGFLRIEKADDGTVYFPDVHHRFHWDPASVCTHSCSTFAYFTNEHAACYLLTRAQLIRALESGGYLVGPHVGKYEMLESAATDIYTQCGFRKLICISDFESSLVHHLPNKYIGKMGVRTREMTVQVSVLLQLAARKSPAPSLFAPHTEVMQVPFSTYYCKSYYEPARTELADLLPTVGTVLSVGCGWGETEQWLSSRGSKVVALPMDAVIAACARSRGIEVVQGDLETVRAQLGEERFDALLISNVLHLVEEPVRLLSMLRTLLTDDAVVITIMPNSARLPDIWKQLRRGGVTQFMNSAKGVRFASPTSLRRWYAAAGFHLDEVISVFPANIKNSPISRASWASPLLASELITLSRPI